MVNNSINIIKTNNYLITEHMEKKTWRVALEIGHVRSCDSHTNMAGLNR